MAKKLLVLIGDGMADEPLEIFGGLTPLEKAETPNMDAAARAGFCGLVKNVPHGMEPGSDVAIMSILGYDPAKYYTGRGPLEALSMGITPAADETVFRCNLVTLDGDILLDYAAGHITTEESGQIMADLQKKFGSDTMTFHHGVSFRNLLVAKGDFSKVKSCAPHDHMDDQWREFQPSGPGAETIVELIDNSIEFLKDHPVNVARIKAGKKPASAVWPWSGGKIPSMDSFAKKYGMSGTVISAVDLVQGLGAAAGLSATQVEGATGLVDTNYEGKVAAAIQALKEKDFVLVHIEGIDEAGHMGNAELKTEGIRRFDRLVVGPMLEELKKYDDYAFIILPDHPTPLRIRTHTSVPVPFIAYHPGMTVGNGASCYTEKQAESTGVLVEGGHTMIGSLISGNLFLEKNNK